MSFDADVKRLIKQIREARKPADMIPLVRNPLLQSVEIRKALSMQVEPRRWASLLSMFAAMVMDAAAAAEADPEQPPPPPRADPSPPREPMSSPWLEGDPVPIRPLHPIEPDLRTPEQKHAALERVRSKFRRREAPPPAVWELAGLPFIEWLRMPWAQKVEMWTLHGFSTDFENQPLVVRNTRPMEADPDSGRRRTVEDDSAPEAGANLPFRVSELARHIAESRLPDYFDSQMIRNLAYDLTVQDASPNEVAARIRTLIVSAEPDVEDPSRPPITKAVDAALAEKRARARSAAIAKYAGIDRLRLAEIAKADHKPKRSEADVPKLPGRAPLAPDEIGKLYGES